MKIYHLTSIVTLISVAAEVKRFDVADISNCNYFYVRLRDHMPPMKYPEEEETFEGKADICMSIIISEWMSVKRDLDMVDLHGEAVYKELQQNYSNLYKEYSSKDGFVNPYRLLNITAMNDESLEHDSDEMDTFEMEEYAFSCLARNRKSGKIEQYFISQEYDLGTCKLKRVVPVFVRFVFTYKAKRGIVPVALTDDKYDNYRLEP